MATALDLHSRGRAENARGRYAAAAELLREALREVAGARAAGGTDIARARVLLTLAWSLAELDGLDRGLAQLNKVYEILDSDTVSAADALPLRTPVHNQHGLLLLRSGRIDDALVHFHKAEQWFEHAPVVERCAVLLNRGALAINTLDITRARADLRRCADLARAGDLPLLEFKATHNLGYLEFLAGDLPHALEVMDQASEIDVEREPGVGLIDRARVLMEAGLTRDADEALSEAISLLGTTDSSTHDFAEAMLEHARCRVQSMDWQTTLRSAQHARRVFLARGNTRRAGSAALLELVAQVGLGRHDADVIASARSLSKDLSAEGQEGDSRSAALLAARLLLESGRDAEAKQLLDMVGPVRSGERIAVKVLHRHVRADLAFASGDVARGHREIRAGLTELTNYRTRFGSIDAQTASAVHGVLLSELDLAVAVRAGRPASIFAAVERSRALSGGMAAVRPPSDDATLALLAELRRLTIRLQADSVPTAETGALHDRRLKLQRAIKSREWRHAGAATERRSVTLARVRDVLEQNATTMVMFFGVAGEIYALSISSHAQRPWVAGHSAGINEQVQRVRADLDVLANPALPAPIEAVVRRSLAHSLTALDELLVRPLRLSGLPLVIVPTGTLGLLPWGMLPSLKGVPVTVAPSATSWHRRRELAGSQLPLTGYAAPRVIALAGPRLERAQHEARLVAATWTNGTARVADDATGAALREALRTADVVHVAAHGRHDSENPLFSSISLADGQVFGYDLVSEVATGTHVVLSACELGLATIRPGDEALGLTRALLHYGAATVVSGVARVADEVAAEVMTRHHRQLAAGLPPAEALAVATGGEDTAPFVCFG